ncbi:phosphate transport system permease protein [Arachidicoccus rhizosphaerae]|jgi:phosphate transport system permease protein|uniref:Phosphate transport system permease protein n=1 Tax=Arachidicoccus rhizosphaerae TaxID=551991 RepID=A0A1H3XRV8_9BACT|nr:ABC transporter permease subunit [Arachidicoccus rhizosphaerae]SEA01292.1 phosphate transport system permease protein [Arachidicoccus rhizosphaerae]
MQNRKILEEKFFLWLMRLVTLSIILVFLFIMGIIIKKGFHAMTWEMISQEPKGGFYFGKGGGILNAIVGSLYLALGSTFFGLLLGLPVALGMNVHWITKTRFVGALRFLLDALWGVPSIVFGAFGFALMAYLGLRASLLAGIITVTLFIVPIFIRAFDEVLRTVPEGLMEAAYSLGANKTQIAFTVFFRQALPGFITAILLAFGRGIGDAASVLFTAGYTDHIPQTIQDPTATLPLAIFFQLSSPIPEVKARAYAAALILTIIILIISVVSRLSTRRFKKNIL